MIRLRNWRGKRNGRFYKVAVKVAFSNVRITPKKCESVICKYVFS